MQTDLFQSCDHCWVFQICWHIECSTSTASSFRIWSSSVGIPLPPLALFVVILHKAPSTSHSRMSGSRWVITPSWLCGSWRSVLYSFSVYSCYLFLISSVSVRSIPFLSFIVANYKLMLGTQLHALPLYFGFLFLPFQVLLLIQCLFQTVFWHYVQSTYLHPFKLKDITAHWKDLSVAIRMELML